MIDGLDDTLANNHRLHAVRADLARRAGDITLARESYLSAMELCANEVEHHYLARQLDDLGSLDR